MKHKEQLGISVGFFFYLLLQNRERNKDSCCNLIWTIWFYKKIYIHVFYLLNRSCGLQQRIKCHQINIEQLKIRKNVYIFLTKKRILKLYTYKTSNLIKCTAFIVFLHLPMPLNIPKMFIENNDLKHALITWHIIGKCRFQNLNDDTMYFYCLVNSYRYLGLLEIVLPFFK